MSATTIQAMRPLWRDLILRVWGTDPLQCPCCKDAMHVVDTFDDEDPGFDLFDQRLECRQRVEVPRGDGCILVLDLD
jgi:hypothetical protein